MTWEEEESWSVVAGKMVAGVGDVVNIKVGRAVYKATIIDSGNTVVYVCMSKVKYKCFIGSKMDMDRRIEEMEAEEDDAEQGSIEPRKKNKKENKSTMTKVIKGKCTRT